MAKEVVRATLSWLKDNDSDLFEERPLRRPRTKKRPLPGAAGLDGANLKALRRFARRTADLSGVDRNLVEHLADIYGSRTPRLLELIEADASLGERLQPDLPYIWAEVAFAVTNDLATTVDDILSRRIPLLLVGRDQGLDVAARAAEVAGALLGWSADRRSAEVARYQKTVANSRLFRTGSV
jgi:glycerol-3-phosphate dehydrogenase